MNVPPRATTERIALAVTTLASFLTPFMGSATNVALPAIGRELALDAVGLSWIATTFLLAAAVTLLPLGRIADIHGRKRVFVLGLLVYGVTSLGCALAPSAGLLLAWRAAQGVGGGMIFGTAVAILASVFPRGRRGRALGVNVAAVYLGLSLGPPLGGVLTEHLGWRSVFLVNAMLGTLAALVAARGLTGESAEAAGEPLDLGGTALYGIGIAALLIGLGRLPGPSGAALALGGVLALAAFVAWERRAPHPVLDVGLFVENRVFAFSNLAALVNYAATYAVGFLLSLHLQQVSGLTPQGAGALLAVQPLVQTLVSPFAGRLSDRVDPRLLASAGMAASASGLAALVWLGPAPGALVPACLVLLGTGFGLFSSPNTNAVMASVDERAYGVASATLATMRLLGQLFSMGIASVILAAFLGRAAVAAGHGAAFLNAARTAFAVFSILCVAGTFASLARGDGAPAAGDRG